MLPGNNGFDEKNLFGEYDLENILTNEGRLQKLKEKLEIEKQRLNQLINYQPKGNPILNRDEERRYVRSAFTFPSVNRIYKNEELELLRSDEKVREQMDYINKKIKQMKKELLPFENKRNNIRPKFEIHIIKHQGYSNQDLIERVDYQGDIHMAQESILKFMFAKRRHPIQVNTLIGPPECPIRMPSDMKMRIKHLDLQGGLPMNIQLVKPIIDKSCLPLEKLTVFIGSRGAQGMDHEIIKTSKRLILNGMDFPFIQNLKNQTVELRVHSDDFLKNDGFINLIKNWVETDKPISTCFRFLFCAMKDDSSIKVLKYVSDRIDGVVAGNKCVYIPMRNYSVLNIRYEQGNACNFLI
uniref:F-box domain-containing protein n=1 Tax=Caenorhabditis tropicalis TaxID=1561998 RepID=A0A1I7TAL1_9PELO